MNTCFKRLSVSATILKVCFLRGLAMAAVILFAFPHEGRAQLAAPDLKEYRARIVEIFLTLLRIRCDEELLDESLQMRDVETRWIINLEIDADVRIDWFPSARPIARAASCAYPNRRSCRAL